MTIPEPSGDVMPARYLSDGELARLSGWPEEIANEDAVTFFTVREEGLRWLTGFNRPDRGRRDASVHSAMAAVNTGGADTMPRSRH